MKKVILTTLIVGVALAVTSCTKTNRQAVNSSRQNDKIITDDHNAQNAIDYDGIYRGTLPCADCEGIKTTVYINRNNTYTLKQDYINKKTSTEEKGTYTWDNTGSIIKLKPTNNGETVQFFVGENTLIQLDKEGNKITSNISDHYKLTKDNYAILNKKWRIKDLYGKPYVADSDNKNEGFIMFNDQDNTFNAYAGCNTMRGEFKILPNNKIELSKILMTMMACENMQAETNLAKVLRETKSFTINIDELILENNKAENIAKFKVPMN